MSQLAPARRPWDCAAGILIAEEAGARLSTIDGTAYSVWDRSLLATNDALYEQVGQCWWMVGRR